jgi:transglutaminase-like putative cysteine protease
MNDQFMPVKLEMEIAQLRIVATLCDKAIATKAVDPPELMAETLIPVKLPDDADRTAKSITYRISRKGTSASRPSAAALPGLPETEMQHVTRDSKRALIVKVTRSGAVTPNPATSKPRPAELDKLRVATAYVNTDDPEVKRLAKEAAGDEKDPIKLIHKLRAFVSDYVQTKDLSVGFATASEVARSKQGDCSEHAVLLAALARACGLPSRGVSGIVYAPRFAGRDDVFVWHMWTQVYVDGRWIDTDAALEQDDLDATHIAMSVVNLNDAALGEMALPIWNLIGRLKIDVIGTDMPKK